VALAIGSRIGPYEVLSAIGTGDMGEVYRARCGTHTPDDEVACGNRHGSDHTHRRVTRAWILGIALAIATVHSISLDGERLPVQIYNASHGLTHDRVRCLLADSRGFLWLCTADGLSRFDGFRFVNYGREQGLPHPQVQDIVEAGPGVYWIATEVGLARLRAAPARAGVERPGSDAPQSRPPNSAVPPLAVYSLGADPQDNHVFTLKVDRAGRMWIGTAGGLFVLERPLEEPRFRRIEPEPSTIPVGQVRAIAEGPDGTLWFGTLSGLYRQLSNGGIIREHSVPAVGQVLRLLVDRSGRIWTNDGAVLTVAVPGGPAASTASPPIRVALPRCRAAAGRSGLPTAPGEACQFETIAGFPAIVRRLWEGSDSRVWIGTPDGLFAFDDTGVRGYSEQHGLPNHVINAIVEDHAGNLWLGTDAAGVVRLARNGFVSFREADGLRHDYVTSISQSRAGRVRVSGGWPALSEFDGQRLTSGRFRIPRRSDFDRLYDVLEDRLGDLWVGTPDGLLRYPEVAGVARLARLEPKATYSVGHGLPGARVAPSFEDSRGDLWMNAFLDARGMYRRVVRWERSSGRFHQYPETDSNVVSLRGPAFAEDSGRTVWLGSRRGLARLRDGRFTTVDVDRATGTLPVTALHFDARGRLWIGTRGAGLYRSDDPTAERPRFTAYTVAHGLSSGTVWCLTDDAAGNLYAGTARGVDRLDPGNGLATRFSVADGLAGSEVITAFRDRDGALWFGTFTGISRLAPRPRAAHEPPTVWIGGLRIGGVAQTVDPLGQVHLALGELAANRNHVQIDYFGLSRAAGESLTYQYRLERPHSDGLCRPRNARSTMPSSRRAPIVSWYGPSVRTGKSARYPLR
jgi:ligand-binding sensor domain-containing protein